MRIIVRCLAAMLIASSWSFIPGDTLPEIAFYVSPHGNDSSPGTSIGKPFATLEKARDAVRALKQKGTLTSPVIVNVLGGRYELSKPFTLTTEDSGTETCPITYRAYNDGKPVISGGKSIKGNWSIYKGNILVCDIPEARNGNWKFRQLFQNGHRLCRARIPDEGSYLRVERTDQDLGKSTFKYKAGDIVKWNNLDQAEIVLLHSWNESRLYISDINEQDRLVSFTGPIGFGLGRYMPASESNRYFVENILEGLDSPGEWYLDYKTGKLYVYPIGDINTSELRAPVLSQLVILKGKPLEDKYVEHINFSGITFTETDYSIPPEGIPTIHDVGDIYEPSAITFDGTKFCSIVRCGIKNTGTYAIEINGDGNKLRRNEISNTGSGGILIRSYGKERNEVVYNHIHDCGDIFFSATGINIDDGGGEISHNLIHNISHSGVYARHWATSNQKQERRNQEQGLVIEYNEIHDVIQKMNDGGGIFVRDSNIVIRNNLIYNVIATAAGTFGRGIYLGCETRYSTVENNVVCNASEGLIAWYATRHMNIQNNIIFNSEIRSVNWESPPDRILQENHFVRNIIYVMRPYAYTYSIQRENTLPLESDYNIIFHAGGKTPLIENRVKGEINTLDAWMRKGYEKNSVFADPLFKDPANHDYTLLPDSPALKLGFRQIDLSTVGLRGSENN